MAIRNIFTRDLSHVIGVQLGELVEPLLSDLVDSTQSDIAILRRAETETRRLDLLAYVCSDSAPDVNDALFRIPIQKGFQCWGVNNPSETYGLASLGPDVDLGIDYVPEPEQAFVDWVREKSWFPLQSEDDVFLVVLLRGRRQPYRLGEVLSAWQFAQEFVSRRLGIPNHAGFASAMDQFSYLSHVQGERDLLQAIVHCACSRLGLGWNRTWLVELTDGAEGKFELVCRACLGETTKGRWGSAVGGTEPEPLDAELRRAIDYSDYRRDSLCQICCGESPLARSLTRTATVKLFQTAAPLPTAYNIVQLMPESVCSDWCDWIASHVKSQTSSFDADRELAYMPINLGAKRYLALFSQPYNQPQTGLPSRTLTTVFLHGALKVLGAWDASQVGQTEFVSRIDEQTDPAALAEELALTNTQEKHYAAASHLRKFKDIDFLEQ